MKPDLISALTAVAALGVNVIFLVFVIKQLRLLQSQITNTSETFALEQIRIKRQSTLEHLATTMSHRQDVAKEVPPDTDPVAVRDFCKDADSNSPNGRLLRNYLNYYENLASGINCDVFDIDVVARTSGTIIVRVFDAYKEFIYRIRKATGHSLAYSELEELAEKLRPRLKRLFEADTRRADAFHGGAVAINSTSAPRSRIQ
ncbi:DUF4760 domain-containing protein [Actinoplanes sp. NPDC026670]|uniref:DUF4760 domain-containing protein n=1 Tax=Actinoplanes sp. NPDC026670 TaxID=3154700 RepID=UPI0033C6AB43